jgi:hypothetical protein
LRAARTCYDYLAGHLAVALADALVAAVAAALCARSLEEGWIRRIEGTRAVSLTAKGQRVFCVTVGMRLGRQ